MFLNQLMDEENEDAVSFFLWLSRTTCSTCSRIFASFSSVLDMGRNRLRNLTVRSSNDKSLFGWIRNRKWDCETAARTSMLPNCLDDWFSGVCREQFELSQIMIIKDLRMCRAKDVGDNQSPIICDAIKGKSAGDGTINAGSTRFENLGLGALRSCQ